MSNENRTTPLAAICLVALLCAGLAACGGGGGGTAGDPASPPVADGGGDGQPDEGGGDAGGESEDEGGEAGADEGGDSGGEDAGDGGLDMDKISSALDYEFWANEGLHFRDADRDGIRDGSDPWPGRAPALSDSASDGSLAVIRAWTNLDGRKLDDVALEGHPLHLEVAGLPPAGATRLWVAFETAEGFRAVTAQVSGDGRLEVMPEAGATGIHVIAGEMRGASYAAQTLRLDQPMLIAPGAPLMAGTTVTLTGRNLDRVSNILLGGAPLTIADRGADSVRVRLPSSARGKRLVAETATERSNTVVLDLRQEVMLRIAPDLPLARGESLVFRIGGTEYRIRPGESVAVELPAWKPTVLALDIAAGDAIRSYGPLRGLVWPGAGEAELSAASTLTGRLASLRRYLPGADGTDWTQARAALDDVLATSAAQDYLMSVNEHAAGRAGRPDEELLNAVVAQWSTPAATTQASGKATPAATEPPPSAKPTTPWGDLDGIVTSTLVSLGQAPEDKNADSTEAGERYPPRDETFGNAYSQIIILRHEDTSLERLSWTGFQGCEYSSDESGWFAIRQDDDDEYAKVWKSDLCIQIDGLVLVSASVVKPGLRNPATIFDAIDKATRPAEMPRERVRRHAEVDYKDSDYQLTPGGYYLKDDRDAPLCHMEQCYIEVITSGYGAYYYVELTEKQKELVAFLRQRMWTETLIPWMLGLAGIGDDENVINCLRDDLMQDADLKAALASLARRIKAEEDTIRTDPDGGLGSAIDAELADWARGYVQGRFGPKFLECAAKVGDPVGIIESRVKDAILEKSGLSTFTAIFSFVSNVGSAVLTPEKFVFRVRPRAEVRTVFPVDIDLYDTDATLYIGGDWLARLDPTAGTPCGGDGWCPELVVRDQFGQTAVVPLDESHVNAGSSACQPACGELAIPYTDFADELQELVGGPVQMELAIADGSYGSYPLGKLRIPVPDSELELTTRAKLIATNPPLAVAGEDITVIGSNLSVYGESAKWRLKERGGNWPDVPLPVKDQTSGSEVTLTVPGNTLEGVYDIIVEPGTDAPVSGLQPLKTETALLVVGRVLPLVVSADQGRVKDDRMRFELRNTKDTVVFLQNVTSPRPLAWDLPTNETNPRADPGSYVYGEVWDDTLDPATDEPVGVDAEVRKVYVRCDVPSSEGACTYGLRSLRDGFCLTKDSEPVYTITGKLDGGEDKTYRLALLTELGQETCEEAFLF
jgi:hypothetical protein